MPRPSRGDKLVGPYAKPKVRGSGWAYQPGTLQLSQDQFMPLDSPAWLAWLDQQLAFRFGQVYYVAGVGLAEPGYLSYTVRPERRQRGQGYWYAYKKYHNQRLPGTYLGQTASLTLTNLDQLALHFLAHINPQFFLSGPVDLGIIDGIANFLGDGFKELSVQTRKLQTGFVRNYALSIFIGVIFIIGYLIIRLG